MKNLLFIVLFVLSTSSLLRGQSGCMQFFPTDEGTILINKSYDASNKLLSTLTYRIDKVYNYQSGTEMKIGFVMTNNKDSVIDSGMLDASCDNGTFYLSMVNRTLSTDVMNLLGSDTELVGDFLDYPDAFSSDNPYSYTPKMTGGKFSIQTKKDKKEAMSVRVYDRKYEKNEQITTPAGTFDAAKISFNFETTKGNKSVIYRGVEWYALNAGIIRAETYDENGKLQNYTVLTTLKKK